MLSPSQIAAQIAASLSFEDAPPEAVSRAQRAAEWLGDIEPTAPTVETSGAPIVLRGTWAEIRRYSRPGHKAWGARIVAPSVTCGDVVQLTSRDGRSAARMVAEVVWSGQGVHLCRLA